MRNETQNPATPGSACPPKGPKSTSTIRALSTKTQRPGQAPDLGSRQSAKPSKRTKSGVPFDPDASSVGLAVRHPPTQLCNLGDYAIVRSLK